MDRLGFIHEKLDIKILILFILRKLPSVVSFEKLTELVLIDDGFDYFEYTQCLAELVNTGHIEFEDGFYKITETGREHGDTVESSLPFSVRAKAERLTNPLVEKMRRDALIVTNHKVVDNGNCMMHLAMSDGLGNIIELSLLTSGEKQAQEMEKYFRSDAENIYHKVIGLLSPEK